MGAAAPSPPSMPSGDCSGGTTGPRSTPYPPPVPEWKQLELALFCISVRVSLVVPQWVIAEVSPVDCQMHPVGLLLGNLQELQLLFTEEQFWNTIFTEIIVNSSHKCCQLLFLLLLSPLSLNGNQSNGSPRNVTLIGTLFSAQSYCHFKHRYKTWCGGSMVSVLYSGLRVSGLSLTVVLCCVLG